MLTRWIGPSQAAAGAVELVHRQTRGIFTWQCRLFTDHKIFRDGPHLYPPLGLRHKEKIAIVKQQQRSKPQRSDLYAICWWILCLMNTREKCIFQWVTSGSVCKTYSVSQKFVPLLYLCLYFIMIELGKQIILSKVVSFNLIHYFHTCCAIFWLEYSICILPRQRCACASIFSSHIFFVFYSPNCSNSLIPCFFVNITKDKPP